VADAQLFTPETAWLSHAYGGTARGDVGQNPAYGASVFFNVPSNYDGKTPVTLSFQDAHGATIRSFALHLKNKHAKKIAPEIRAEMDAVHQRALELKDITAIEPGMNRFQWDMRYAPATEVLGFREPTTDDFLDNVNGPTIVPGAYTAVLQYGAKRLTQPLRLQLDPRLHPTAADLDARLALETRVHDTLDSLNKTIDAAMASRAHLSPAKRAQLDRAIADVVQLNIHSTEGDVLVETKLRDHLAFLANELELAYEKPTAAEYATYADLQKQAAAGETRLRTLTASP
jgi:hypothetical protein